MTTTTTSYQSSPPLSSSSSFSSSSPSSPLPFLHVYVLIYVHACACGGKRCLSGVLTNRCIFFLRQCLSLNTELTDFTRQAIHHVPRTSLSPHSTLHSQHWVYRSVPQPYIIFFCNVNVKDRTRVPVFASQAFYWLRFSTSLKDPNFFTSTVPIVKQWKVWPFLGVTLALWWLYGIRPTKILMTHFSAT